MSDQLSSLPLSRTCLITGGASGIGAATARLLATQRFRVIVSDIDFPIGTREEFARQQIETVLCDVTRESDVAAWIEGAARATGRIDCLVHSAGVGLVKPITDVSEAEWDRVLDVNLKGAFLCAKHAIPHLRRAGGGSLVNIASNAGLLPRFHDPVYSISKWAVVALTKTLALCHAPEKIRVNAVCPGPVGDTRMMDADLASAADRERAFRDRLAASPIAHGLGRMIRPDEVAESVAYLVSDAAVFVTGCCLTIDGGKSLGVPPTLFGD
jgi:NAD(P)-dependent dehydrogenase (short-subunit alcohol dehydrogenase family)